MKLNVGDYIRTDDGLIGKVVSEAYEYKDSIGCDIDFGNNDIYNQYEMYQSIIKSRPKITDLVEVGDYVNGSKVIKIEEYNDEKYIYVEEMEFCNACNEDENVYYKEDSINSILTKEQFEAMQYVVGDTNVED